MQANVRARDAADAECGRLLDILDEVRVLQSVSELALTGPFLGLHKVERNTDGRDSVLGFADGRIPQQRCASMTAFDWHLV